MARLDECARCQINLRLTRFESSCAMRCDNITPMSTFDLEALAGAMVPVSRAINTSLTAAVVDVETACRETLDLPNTPVYQTPRVHLTRAATHRRLSMLGEIDGWNLSTQAGPNTPIHLYRGTNTIRLLHTPNTTTVPAPGKNMARQFYYTNTAFEGLAEPNAFYVHHNYLLLWRQGFTTGEIALRLVRPIGVWKFGMPAKWDRLLLPALRRRRRIQASKRTRSRGRRD